MKVFITGASGGIGSATAKEFIKKGYTVFGSYFSDEKSAKELEKEGCKMLRVDFSDRLSIKKACDEINLLGGIDVLVNNVGISEQGLFTDFSDEKISQMIDVNLTSTMLITKQLLPPMVSRKFGRIINVSSIWGVYGGSCEVPYSASKAGLIGFTKALSRELGLSNITVNCISPGFINTKMNDHLEPTAKDEFCANISLGRIGTPSEVAHLIGYLASREADYITGQIIGVDGGF